MSGKTLTTVLPVKEPQFLQNFIEANYELLQTYPLRVIDSGGGGLLRNVVLSNPKGGCYIQENLSMWEARKKGYQDVATPYILNLDDDTVLPASFIPEALKLLQVGADCVAIDYGPPQGHLAFGASIWRRELLQKLYNYSIRKCITADLVQVGSDRFSNLDNGWCECTYMWARLRADGGKLATLPMAALHLK